MNKMQSITLFGTIHLIVSKTSGEECFVQVSSLIANKKTFSSEEKFLMFSLKIDSAK